MTAPLWLAVIIGKSNPKNDPLVLSIIIGLILAFVLGGGFGSYLGNQTSHCECGADRCQWLKFFGWARDGGDLRATLLWTACDAGSATVCSVATQAAR